MQKMQNGSENTAKASRGITANMTDHLATAKHVLRALVSTIDITGMNYHIAVTGITICNFCGLSWIEEKDIRHSEQCPLNNARIFLATTLNR